MHISRKVSLKTKTNPEMYIWDPDKAIEDMKSQVPCFKWVTPPAAGDGVSLWWVSVQICI